MARNANSRPYRPVARVRLSAELLPIEIALASGKIEIVTMAETFQDRLNVNASLPELTFGFPALGPFDDRRGNAGCIVVVPYRRKGVPAAWRFETTGRRPKPA